MYIETYMYVYQVCTKNFPKNCFLGDPKKGRVPPKKLKPEKICTFLGAKTRKKSRF